MTHHHIAVETLETCILDVCSLMTDNKLKLNNVKTEFPVVIPKYYHKVFNTKELHLRIGDQELSLLRPWSLL